MVIQQPEVEQEAAVQQGKGKWYVTAVQVVAHCPLDMMEWELDCLPLQQQDRDGDGDHDDNFHDDAVGHEWNQLLSQH